MNEENEFNRSKSSLENNIEYWTNRVATHSDIKEVKEAKLELARCQKLLSKLIKEGKLSIKDIVSSKIL